MPVLDFDHWETELVETGRIVQDSDTSVLPEEAERRSRRYLALVEMLNATEGLRAARALLRSIQVHEDYEVYESTKGKFLSFPHIVVAEALMMELPRLIKDLPDHAGDILSLIALGSRQPDDRLIETFNRTLTLSDANVRTEIRNFIRRQEDQGWLADEKTGQLGT